MSYDKQPRTSLYHVTVVLSEPHYHLWHQYRQSDVFVGLRVELEEELLINVTAAIPQFEISCRVVDCVPRTVGWITEETALVVVSAAAALPPPHKSFVSSLRTSNCTLSTSPLLVHFVPPLPSNRQSSVSRNSLEAWADESLLRELGVADGSTLQIDNSSITFIARIHKKESSTVNTLTCTSALWMLLLNNRAQLDLMNADEAATMLLPHAVTLPLNSLLPVDQFLPPATETPNSKGNNHDAPILQSLVLVPAVHASWLLTVLGESYMNVIEALLKRAVLGGVFDHVWCAEDATLFVPFHVPSPLTTEHRALSTADWTEAMEQIEQTLISVQHVSKTLATQNMPTWLSILGIPLRVALVASGNASLPSGLVRTSGARTTEILLKPSSAHASLARDESMGVSIVPVSLVYQPAPHLLSYPFLKGLVGVNKIQTCLECHFLQQFGGLDASVSRPAVLSLTVYGSAENLTFEQAMTACEMIGVIPLAIDQRSSSSTMAAAPSSDGSHPFTRLLDGVAGNESAPHVYVLRHAEQLTAREVSAIQQSMFALRKQQKQKPFSFPSVMMLIVESQDPQCPLNVGALSDVTPIRVTVPGDSDRHDALHAVLSPSSHCPLWGLSRFVSFDTLQQWTVGLPLADVVHFALSALWDILVPTNSSTSQRAPSDIGLPVLDALRLEDVLKTFQRAHGHNLASTKLQPVRWSDVGGLEDAKEEIMETIQLPMLHPEMFQNGLKRRAGILLYGPPGCGKTLIAKAVATELNVNFISVKGPELINQYVGESERNVRNLFQRARDSAPCIVFFDELDALVPARGAKGDAGGAMDRIVAQLLVEVDGAASAAIDEATGKPKDIFIIGATNRPDLLDPALLRPGRFDRLCYLGLPSTNEEQLFAIRALTRKFHLAEDVNLNAIVEAMDFVYTGADFFALCSDAMMLAVDDVVERVKAKLHEAGENEDDDDDTGDDNVVVCQRHFLTARANLKASVTPSDLRRYEALRSTFAKK